MSVVLHTARATHQTAPFSVEHQQIYLKTLRTSRHRDRGHQVDCRLYFLQSAIRSVTNNSCTVRGARSDAALARTRFFFHSSYVLLSNSTLKRRRLLPVGVLGMYP